MRWHQDSKLIVNVSKKKWVEGESEGVELGFEGNTDGDTDLAKAYEDMYRELEALAESFLNGQTGQVASGIATKDEISNASGLHSIGHVGTRDGVSINKVGEPYGKLTVAVTPAGAEEGPPLPPEPANLPKPEPVNVPIAENGDELEGFLVKHFVIAVSDSGTKIAKTFGGRVMLHGATAWPEVMEPLFDITDLDKGQKFDPPYPIKAWCTKSAGGWPNKVISFEKV